MSVRNRGNSNGYSGRNSGNGGFFSQLGLFLGLALLSFFLGFFVLARLMPNAAGPNTPNHPSGSAERNAANAIVTSRSARPAPTSTERRRIPDNRLTSPPIVKSVPGPSIDADDGSENVKTQHPANLDDRNNNDDHSTDTDQSSAKSSEDRSNSEKSNSSDDSTTTSNTRVSSDDTPPTTPRRRRRRRRASAEATQPASASNDDSSQTTTTRRVSRSRSRDDSRDNSKDSSRDSSRGSSRGSSNENGTQKDNGDAPQRSKSIDKDTQPGTKLD